MQICLHFPSVQEFLPVLYIKLEERERDRERERERERERDIPQDSSVNIQSKVANNLREEEKGSF